MGRGPRQTVYTHTHTLTHTAGGRCGGPARAPPSGRAWAGSSRCIWRGFLAGRTRSPGLWDRQATQAGAASTVAAARVAQPHLEGQLQDTQEGTDLQENLDRPQANFPNSQVTVYHSN